MTENSKKNSLNPLRLTARLDITGKFVLPLLIGMLILATASEIALLAQQEKSYNELIASSEEVVNKIFDTQNAKSVEALRAKAQNLSSLLAAIAPSAIVEFELSALSQYATVVNADPDISYVAFVAADGTPLAEVGAKESDNADHGDHGLRMFETKIESEGLELGKVVVIYNFDAVNANLEQAKLGNEKDRAVIHAAKEESLRQASLFLTVAFGVTIAATLALIVFLFKWIVARRLSLLESNLRDIAQGEGDLNKRIQVTGTDGVDRLGQNFNLFVEKIHRAVTRVNDTAEQLASASQQMASITDESSRDISEQKSETTQVATAINQMAATVQEVARNAAEAATAAHSADAEASTGKNVVNSSVTAIHKLAEDVENAAEVISKLKADSVSIGSVLDVIKGIAEQTNLLALNAAIEAARAGEQGRGFAVVADEVRTLAQRTQESTTDIQVMIESIQASAEKAVGAMEAGRQQAQASVEKATSAGESFETITASIATINDMNTHIASAAEEQNAVADEINRNIGQISIIAERSATSARKTESSSNDLSGMADELSSLMAQFKI